jgi:hypothetical protein
MHPSMTTKPWNWRYLWQVSPNEVRGLPYNKADTPAHSFGLAGAIDAAYQRHLAWTLIWSTTPSRAL